MKRLPYVVLLLATVGFVVYVLQTREQLPERVATHFDIRGAPDGWMTRDGFLRFTVGFGLGVPIFMAAVFSLVRIVPAHLINLPHREHWLSPERRAETMAWISRGGVWIGCVFLVFMGLMHAAVVKANEQLRPRLDTSSIMIAAGVVVLVTAVFIICLLLRFSKPPAQPV